MLKSSLLLTMVIGLSVLAANHLLSVEARFMRQLLAETEQAESTHVFTDFLLVNTDTSGLKESEIQSPLTRYVVHRNETTLDSPTMLLYRGERPPVSLTADTAIIDHEKNKTTLRHNVEISSTGHKNKRMRMTTDSLLIDNTNQTAQTESHANVYYGNSHMQGVGMEFELKTEQFKFLSEVRGTYEN